MKQAPLGFFGAEKKEAGTSGKQMAAAPPAKAAAADTGVGTGQGSQTPAAALPPLPVPMTLPSPRGLPLPISGCANLLPAMVGGSGAIGPNLFGPARAPPTTYFALVARTSAILQRMLTWPIAVAVEQFYLGSLRKRFSDLSPFKA